MAKAKYWKLGNRYAGITARGKRFLVDSLAQARAKIGLKSKSKARRATKAPKPKTIRRRRNMPRRKNKRKGGRSIMRTAEKFIGVAAFLAPGIKRGGDVYRQTKDIGQAFVVGATTYAGINRDGKFDWTILAQAWGPVLAFKVSSALAHKVSGIIRRL